MYWNLLTPKWLTSNEKKKRWKMIDFKRFVEFNHQSQIQLTGLMEAAFRRHGFVWACVLVLLSRFFFHDWCPFQWQRLSSSPLASSKPPQALLAHFTYNSSIALIAFISTLINYSAKSFGGKMWCNVLTLTAYKK